MVGWVLIYIAFCCFEMKVGKTVKSKEADYVLDNVNNMARAISEVWVGGSGAKDGSNQSISRTRSDIELDSVLTATAVGA